mgnify:CR=1 FL=1
MEGDFVVFKEEKHEKHFNPLPPHGGRRKNLERVTLPNNISIHSLRMEGDLTYLFFHNQGGDFNPLPPHGGRLVSSPNTPYIFSFQSTPSAWRETEPFSGKVPKLRISIHSLRMEGDKVR